MENKMYARQAFKCSVCGQEYDNAMSRARCELNCIKKQEEEEKKAAEIKKKEEYEASCAELSKAIDTAYALAKTHLQKYGEYKYNGTEEDLQHYNINLRPNKLWNYFLF